MCTMAINNQHNGIELTFERKPSEAVRAQMRAAGFRWHGQKKLWYARRTDDRMALALQLSGEAAPVSVKKPAARAASAPDCRYGLKPGDVLYDSWGYNMTIVDYYKITKILSPCKVEIQKIGAKVISTDRGGGEMLLPDPDDLIGEPLQKMISKCRYSSLGWHIKISSSVQLRPWNGQPNYQNTYD